jgi:hypothetical protein
MLPQIEIAGIDVKYLLGLIIIGMYAFPYLKPKLISFFSKASSGTGSEILDNMFDEFKDGFTVPPAASHSSDAPAPKGTAEYIQLIMESAPDATDTLRLSYAMKELTEAQILKEEVTRKLPKTEVAPK